MKQQKNPATLFGEYLDNDNFDAVRKLISSDCEYTIGGKILTGKEEILDLYETNMKEGKELFDELVWGDSKVEQIGDQEYEVYFSDFLTHKGITHNYNCKQRLVLNDAEEIIRIAHIELPGEKEKLKVFYQKVGIKED